MLYFEPYEKDKYWEIQRNFYQKFTRVFRTCAVFVEQNLSFFETHKYNFKYYKNQEHWHLLGAPNLLSVIQI
jgi:hypothetical protein